MEPDLRSRAASALDELLDAARRAGEIALRDFRLGEPTSARVDTKYGGSPVTAADLAVDHYLAERLRRSFPDAGWLSEETADDPARLEKTSLLVIDPIDGTRAFLAGDPRWAVSIALVEAGRPIAGVVHAPALRETFAAALGGGARLDGRLIRAAERTSVNLARVAGPKPMIAALSAAAGVELIAFARIPSLALRLVEVARGGIDIGLASANAHDWDIAAADIVLREAGAQLTDPGGAAPLYNTERTRHGVLLACATSLAPALAAPARKSLT
ncbi:MAG: 3'(2'),5'-bisphosphate nucleotidase CysQ [Hyphomicrobiales bacterium]|nr:3'(2'),5'-bisphosphate nucleotidase CysQ [Hyphomicrobiales bacterium]